MSKVRRDLFNLIKLISKSGGNIEDLKKGVDEYIILKSLLAESKERFQYYDSILNKYNPIANIAGKYIANIAKLRNVNTLI